MEAPALVPGEQAVVVVDLAALGLVVVRHVAAGAARLPKQDTVTHCAVLCGVHNTYRHFSMRRVWV